MFSAPGTGGKDVVVPHAAAAGNTGGGLLALSDRSLAEALRAKVQQEQANGAVAMVLAPLLQVLAQARAALDVHARSVAAAASAAAGQLPGPAARGP